MSHCVRLVHTNSLRIAWTEADRGLMFDNSLIALARWRRMSSERYCHTPGIVVVVVADNFRLKFLFINLSQVKVSVY